MGGIGSRNWYRWDKRYAVEDYRSLDVRRWQQDGLLEPGRWFGEYLRTMLAGCSLEDWQAIVGRAVTDAKGGDAKAREWLARYLIGTPEAVAPRLFEMAIEAEAGIDPVEEGASEKRMFAAIMRG